jgi:hypothetical protein
VNGEQSKIFTRSREGREAAEDGGRKTEDGEKLISSCRLSALASRPSKYFIHELVRPCQTAIDAAIEVEIETAIEVEKRW